jgi:hypothetical protein
MGDHPMKPVTFLVAALALSACDVGVESRKASPPAVQEARGAVVVSGLPPRAGQPPVRPIVPAGPAQAVSPVADASLQDEASVVRVDPLRATRGPTVKLFGAGGGDPAMNGLYTHIAFFQGPAEGWRVFRLGDVLDYRILSEAPGRVDLEFTESTGPDAAGAIGSRRRKVIVSWTPGADGAPPASVSLTPAR